MKKIILLIGLSILLLFAAACGDGETATPEATEPVEEATTAPEPTEAIPEQPLTLAAPEVVPLDQVQNVVWQWSELVEVEPSAQSVVPDPENYTLVLWDDSTYSFEADCNMGSGSYTADAEGNLSLEPGPTTLAECGAESLYNQFISLLGSVTNFGLESGRLALLANEGKALMKMNYGGPGEKPEPAPTVCAGIEMESVSIDTMGLPYPYQVNCVLETPYDSSQALGPTGMPDHVQINFGVTDPNDWELGDPILYIIPVAAYEQLWNESGDATVSNQVAALNALLLNKPDPIPSSNNTALPFSASYGTNDLSVQGDYLDIKMGSGVRFVGRFVQETVPVSNDDPQLFYVFQGFTEDGVYLISLAYPVSSDAIPAAGEITDEERAQVEEDPQAYMQGKAEELNELSPTEWDPPLTTLDGMINSLEFEYQAPQQPETPAAPTLINVNWQWFDLVETDPASQSVIPNPEGYVVIFLSDGTLDLLADCNFGSGTYALDGNNITITVGPITQIECEEGSLSTEFTTLLANAGTYELTANQLTLNLNDDAGRVGVAYGGPALLPPTPGEDVPTATTVEPVNVRRGPGTVYPSYGVVPAETLFEVVGVSGDGTWWVVRIPTEVAASGQGWLSAAYVTTENTDTVPVIPAPPLDDELPPGTPIATTTEPVNIRSGPGTAYPSFGISPAGTTFEVVGKSVDGTWYVIKLPTEISPEGRGWVNARYVEVSNVEDVPEIETPPVP